MQGRVDQTEQPSVEDIRIELARVTAGGPFAHSPRLASFLRFVVETTLEGHGERLKGYTVGVEALGRAADFDPQADPIVRVEAGRLRRALARYYAEDGRDDPVLIDLPSGSYVPSFSRRRRQLRKMRKDLSRAWPLPFRASLLRLGLVAAVVVGIAVAGTLAFWQATQVRTSNPVAGEPIDAEPFQAVSPFPVLIVEAFDTARLAEPMASAVSRLRGKLRDALVRFDEIEVAAEPTPEQPDITGSLRDTQRDAYRLALHAEASSDGALSLYFRLYDGHDRLIIWTRSFDDVRIVNGAVADENDLVLRLAPALAQPYGIIYARELARGPGHLDPRYRCVIEAFEFYRWHDRERRLRIRACIGQITTNASTFAEGFALLAFEHLRDHYDKAGDALALERAVSAAQRAVSLDSQSARANQVMMNVLYARGDVAAALAVGRQAVASNPWDMIVLTSYGIRLLWSGDIDQATALLQKADEFGPAQPQFLSYALFMAAYMRNDAAAAARYANRLVSDSFAYGLAARAIVAQRAGDRDRARRDIGRLVQLNPNWRRDAQAELRRYGIPAAVAARMASDLDAAGIRDTD